MDFLRKRKKQSCGETGTCETEKIFQQTVLDKQKLYIQNEIRKGNYPMYDLEYIKKVEGQKRTFGVNAQNVGYDISMKQWRLRAQLDEKSYYYLSVFFDEEGTIQNYSLDEEAAHDSHDEFRNEKAVRWRLYQPGDEHKYLHEIFSCYIKKSGGMALHQALEPFILAEFHYD